MFHTVILPFSHKAPRVFHTAFSGVKLRECSILTPILPSLPRSSRSVPHCFLCHDFPKVFCTLILPSLPWRGVFHTALSGVKFPECSVLLRRLLWCGVLATPPCSKQRVTSSLTVVKTWSVSKRRIESTFIYCLAVFYSKVWLQLPLTVPHAHTLLVRFLRPPIRAEEQFRYFVGNVYADIWFISGINKTYICIIFLFFLFFCFSLQWFDWIGSKRGRSMIDWLNDWLIDCFIDSLIGWLIQLRGPYERETQPIKVRVAYKKN